MAITASLIELDRAADTPVPLTLREKASGQLIDLSTADLTFMVKGSFTLTPGAHPMNPLGRALLFTEAHAALLGSKARDFMLTQRDGDTDKVLWRGQIVATGFAR